MKDFFSGVEGVASLIVVVALVSTVVAPKAITDKVVTAFGNAFAGGIKAAKS